MTLPFNQDYSLGYKSKEDVRDGHPLFSLTQLKICTIYGNCFFNFMGLNKILQLLL